MKTKSIIALNGGWAAAAIAAFFVGKGSPGEAETEAVGKNQGSGLSAAEGQDPSALPGSGGSLARGGGSAAAAAEIVTAENVEGLMIAALSDMDPLRRKSRIAKMLVALTPEQVPGMLAAFENNPRTDESSGHFRDFLYAWGRVGGKDAIAYMMDPESKRKDHYGGTSAIAGWAAVDREGAKDYVGSVENAHAKEWLHYGVFREELRTDLDGAIAYSEENTKSRARGRQMDMITRAIFDRDGIDGLTSWVAGIDHTAEGNDLLSYKQYASSIVLDRLAGDDPAAAEQWIVDNAEAPFVTADGLERAARRAGGEIDEELSWLVQLPEEVNERRHAIGERFEDFIREDFEQAGNWLAAQELGPAFDEAIEDYARSAARSDRDAALAWAERITDPQMREQLILRLTPQVQPTFLNGASNS